MHWPTASTPARRRAEIIRADKKRAVIGSILIYRRADCLAVNTSRQRGVMRARSRKQIAHSMRVEARDRSQASRE